jgi:membrane protease subunit HflK
MSYDDGSDSPWGNGKKPQGKSPWGGANGSGNKGSQDDKPTSIPEIDDMVRKGQERLKALLGGRGGSGGSGGKGSAPGGFSKGSYGLFGLFLIFIWAYASFYTVKPEEKSIELMLGKYYRTGVSGLNFAPWPLISYEVLTVTRENTEDIGVGNSRSGTDDEGLMLTGDENIVDIDFSVVWNIADPAKFLFNLAQPRETIKAVSESAMREVIARSELAPILNRDRAVISAEVRALIQTTLDSYDSGVNIVRMNFEKADPPAEVIDAFRDVQAAEQEKDTLEKQADAYANQALAEARGEAAQLVQEAEGYKAKVVNESEGEAARFISVYEEYVKAKDVTRKRIYLERMENILKEVDKVILDSGVGGDAGVVPYLPLNQLRTGGNN